MRTTFLRFGLVLAVVGFGSLFFAVTTSAFDDDPQAEPVAGIKDIMNAVNHESGGLYGMIKTFCASNPPKTSGDWKIMRHRAAMIAEAGNTMMGLQPPQGAEDDAGMKKWRQHCAAFRDASKKLKRPIALKKVADVQAALEGIMQTCNACHKDHRPE